MCLWKSHMSPAGKKKRKVVWIILLPWQPEHQGLGWTYMLLQCCAFNKKKNQFTESESCWCKTIQSQQEILWISRTGRLPTNHPSTFLYFAFNQRENKRFILRYGFSLTLALEPSVSVHTVFVFRQLFVNTNKVFGPQQHEADGLLSVVQTQQQKTAPLDSCSLAKLSCVAGGGFLLN